MDIFTEIKKLNLPPDQYIVVGSGIMHALGIKQSHDIDIVATPELFETLRASGEWREWQRPGNQGIRLDRGMVEVFLHVNCGDFNPTTSELIAGAQIIKGIPFIPLETLLKFKRAYQREKDFKDIALIEQYLERRS